MRTIIVLLAGLSASAWGADPPSPCREFGEIGCYFIPDSAKPGASVDLLVYLRGHLQGSGTIPPGKRLASARQAFTRYGLQALAERQGLALIVTGSSNVSLRPDDLALLEQTTGRKMGRLLLAAHSGGYVGLSRTLDDFGKVDRIAMLDDFYFSSDVAKKIQRHVQGGAACAGYFTAHNKARLEANFKPFVYCPVEPHDDYGHEDGVARCLGDYLTQTTCP